MRLHMVFNRAMSQVNNQPDAALIEHFGGPAALAKRLGLTDRYATQRVHNWIKRGIPPAIRLKHRSLFDRAERQLAKAGKKA